MDAQKASAFFNKCLDADKYIRQILCPRKPEEMLIGARSLFKYPEFVFTERRDLLSLPCHKEMDLKEADDAARAQAAKELLEEHYPLDFGSRPKWLPPYYWFLSAYKQLEAYCLSKADPVAVEFANNCMSILSDLKAIADNFLRPLPRCPANILLYIEEYSSLEEIKCSDDRAEWMKVQKIKAATAFYSACSNSFYFSEEFLAHHKYICAFPEMSVVIDFMFGKLVPLVRGLCASDIYSHLHSGEIVSQLRLVLQNYEYYLDSKLNSKSA